MSDEVVVQKKRSEAAEELISSLKGQGFSPTDAVEILVASAISIVQLSKVGFTKEVFFEGVSEIWDGMASVTPRRDLSGKAH